MIRDENIDYICLYGYVKDDELVKGSQMFTAGWGLDFRYCDILFFCYFFNIQA